MTQKCSTNSHSNNSSTPFDKQDECTHKANTTMLYIEKAALYNDVYQLFTRVGYELSIGFIINLQHLTLYIAPH